jgi:hypothetical protein
MNLKLRRLVRTPTSEQYALFDLDKIDENYEPTSAGKVDLHFVSEAVYGTFLLWNDVAAGISAAEARSLVLGILTELCEPMGLPAEYAVEFFSPDLGHYELFTNALEAGEGIEESE